MTELIKVRKMIEDVRWDIDGDLNEAIEYLQSVRDTAVADGYERLSIDINSYDGSTEVEIYGYRLEKPAEASARVERKAATEARIAEQEKAQLAALKAKYG